MYGVKCLRKIDESDLLLFAVLLTALLLEQSRYKDYVSSGAGTAKTALTLGTHEVDDERQETGQYHACQDFASCR